ncbi:MAG: DnaJ domain-containing protein [Pseudomonadota bacterium]
MTVFVKYLIITIVLLYFFLPLDLLPDFMHPLLGRLDDVLVAVLGYSFYKKFASKWIYRKIYQEYQRHSQQSSSGNSFGSNFSLKDPYEILEIKKGCNKEEIKKAYYQKMSEYHPDKVAHLGIELQDFAKEKTIEIQKAYEEVVSGKS